MLAAADLVAAAAADGAGGCAAHLLLGLNLEGLREACELVGFPYRRYKDGIKLDAWGKGGLYGYKYKRKDHTPTSPLSRPARQFPATWQTILFLRKTSEPCMEGKVYGWAGHLVS